MKYLLTIVSVFAMIIFYSCNPKQEPCPELPVAHPNGVYEITNLNSITRDTFNVWRARWKSNYRSYMASDSLHYFDMPLLDLTSIISNQNINGSRIYMGMAYDSGRMTPHTMIVGTQNGITDYSAILDYSSACPRNCPGGN